MTEPLDDLALGILTKIAAAAYRGGYVSTDGTIDVSLDDLDGAETDLLRVLLEQAERTAAAEYAAFQARLDVERGTRVHPGLPRPTTWKPGELTPDVDPNPPRLAFPAVSSAPIEYPKVTGFTDDGH